MLVLIFFILAALIVWYLILVYLCFCSGQWCWAIFQVQIIFCISSLKCLVKSVATKLGYFLFIGFWDFFILWYKSLVSYAICRYLLLFPSLFFIRTEVLNFTGVQLTDFDCSPFMFSTLGMLSRSTLFRNLYKGFLLLWSFIVSCFTFRPTTHFVLTLV